jgi:preprotein translocase subunit SecD
VAAMALVIYTVIVLAIYKLIPVTLTLPGIAGFIVSLGMAVDANCLIFERLKEELRAGRTLKAAIDTGFSRAWPAIRDSNVTTFIACAILYWFGSSIPTATVVMGFAVTLFIGVAVSMFSAIVITKTLLLLLVGGRFSKRMALFGVEERVEAKGV